MNDELILPENTTYIGLFLMLSCNYSCSYCLNHVDRLVHRKHLSVSDWIQILNRIPSRDDLPITIQGGEPTIHSGFYDILKGLDRYHKVDLLTNGSFDHVKFANEVPLNIFSRITPYPTIRVSYHPSECEPDILVRKVKYLNDKGFNAGLFLIDHPKSIQANQYIKKRAESMGVLVKSKEFLGEYDNKIYGEYKYSHVGFGQNIGPVLCKTSEVLIDPLGFLFKCHSDLYAQRDPIGDLLSKSGKINFDFRICENAQTCHPCDIKVKTNRFQEFGHTTVEIKNGNYL